MFRVAFYYHIPWLLFFCIIVADAVVTTVMDTKHALGLTTDDGADILIHVGLDTVKLNGAPFTLHVNEGDHVVKGQLLLTADLAAIQAAGCQIYTPVLVTNTDDFVSVKIAKTGAVAANQLEGA